VATAGKKAAGAKKHIATLTLQSEVRFASAAARTAFAEELSNAVARIVAKYYDDETEGGRSFRLLVASYPKIRKENRSE
jgi:hypothetical protein